MTYSVGNSEVANYANTSSGKVTNVVADNGVGGSGESVNVVDRVALSFVISVNTPNAVVDVTSVVGYIAGKSDITVTVNPNVYAYGVVPTIAYSQSPDPAYYNDLSLPYAGLEIVGGASGDTIKLVNNGYITGYGGDGSGMAYWSSICCCSGYDTASTYSRPGGAALSFVTPGINLVIENNGYIAGGGGGGGAAFNTTNGGGSPSSGAFGGGGAGGGICYGYFGNRVRATPTSPTGLNGSSYLNGYDCVSIYMYQGGGGGFTLPGVGGALGPQGGFIGVNGVGGSAGGSGAASQQTGVPFTAANDGGSGNSNAGDSVSTRLAGRLLGGGGGGWGASGGTSYNGLNLAELGSPGGNSILTNGNAYTMLGDGNTRLWGTVNASTRTLVYTFPATAENAVLDFNNIPQFTVLPFGLQVVLIVPANVTLYSLNPTIPGLKIGATTTRNCTVRLVVNGNILGVGGTGGGENTLPSAGGYALQVGSAALSNTFPLIIDNQVGYIGGGGGGGGFAANNATYASATRVTYGGGGAGGGASGAVGDFAYNARITALNTNGNNGTSVVNGIKTYSSAGTGGTILPGVRKNNIGTFTGGVSYPGLGGQAGGSGAFYNGTTVSNPNNYGGAFGENGGTPQTVSIGNQGCAGGGGGGWGAAGGNGRQTNQAYQSGAAGGYSIVVSDYGSGPGNIWVGSSSHLGGAVIALLV